MLVRRHVPEFADRIDFRSLETLTTELIGKGFVKRYADMLLRAELKDEDGALVLSIEFQDRPERNMASRTTMYNLLVAQTLMDDDRKHGPPQAHTGYTVTGASPRGRALERADPLG